MPAGYAPAPIFVSADRHRLPVTKLEFGGFRSGTIYEVLPLRCPFCSTQMRIIAFINDASAVRRILDHLGEPTRPPRIAPARGPPLWEAATAAAASSDPAWDHTPPPAPAIEFDQRITW